MRKQEAAFTDRQRRAGIAVIIFALMLAANVAAFAQEGGQTICIGTTKYVQLCQDIPDAEITPQQAFEWGMFGWAIGQLVSVLVVIYWLFRP